MDAIRDASGVSLKRLYRLYPAKDRLAEATLRRRANAFREAVIERAAAGGSPREQILAVFDLHDWFSQPDYRGCPFINAFGEAHRGGVMDSVAEQKRGLAGVLDDLVAAAGGPPALGRQLLILANGAMVTAATLDSPDAAVQAKAAARTLLDASL